MPQPTSSVLPTLTEMKKEWQEWQEWLKSPVRLRRDRRGKPVKVDLEAPPPALLVRVLLEIRLENTPGCREIIHGLVHKGGCDEEVLLKHLENLMRSEMIDRRKPLYGGMEPRQIKAATKRWLKSVDEIEKLNSGVVDQVLIREKGWVILSYLAPLLRAYAGIWSVLPGELSHVSPDSQAKLSRYVVETTGRPQYEQLAQLISAVCDRVCDAGALKQWCRKNGLTKKQLTGKK